MSSSNANDEDVPIPGPTKRGPDHIWDPDLDMPMSPTLMIGRTFLDLIRVPTRWFRENIIEQSRGEKYYWYHKRFQRPLPIDECYMDDLACAYEADLEYKRNRMIDKETLALLRYRRDSCHLWNVTAKGSWQPSEKCRVEDEVYAREEINFFIKYGELQFKHSVVDAYMKQKNRMIVERRRALREEAEGRSAENN